MRTVERDPDRHEVPGMHKRIFQVVLGILLGLVVTLVWFAISKPSEIAAPADQDQIGGILPAPFTPPALTGTDVDGHPFSTDDLAGSHVAVFFGFTSCPDVCPLTLARLARYRAELPAEAQDRLRLLFVTVDPDRDTPDRIQSYLQGFPGGVSGLRSEEIFDQLMDWGVHAARGEEYAPGEYLVEHTARTFILNEEGAIAATLPPMADQQAMAAILNPLLGVSR